MDKVTEAIEKVFRQRPTPQRPTKATLRDLFGLDSGNGGWKKFSDQGAALGRLDASTLDRLRGFFIDHEQEAINDYGESRYKHLHGAISLQASLKSPAIDNCLMPRYRYALQRNL